MGFNSIAQGLMKVGFFVDRFSENGQVEIECKSVQYWPSSMRTDGQTGMKKLIVAFRNFAKAPKKNFLLSIRWKGFKLNKGLTVRFHRRVFVNIKAPRDRMTRVAWPCHSDRSCH
jgi:hypothetical protein